MQLAEDFEKVMPSLHAKKVFLPSQLLSYTPEHARPRPRQAACALASVVYDRACFWLAPLQCFKRTFVHVKAVGPAADEAVGADQREPPTKPGCAQDMPPASVGGTCCEPAVVVLAHRANCSIGIAASASHTTERPRLAHPPAPPLALTAMPMLAASPRSLNTQPVPPDVNTALAVTSAPFS